MLIIELIRLNGLILIKWIDINGLIGIDIGLGNIVVITEQCKEYRKVYIRVQRLPITNYSVCSLYLQSKCRPHKHVRICMARSCFLLSAFFFGM